MPATPIILKIFRYLGCGLLIVGGALGWLNAPLSGWLEGYSLVPFDSLPLESQSIRVFSFGVFASLSGIIGFLFMSRDRVRGAVGLFGLTLAVLFVYYLGFLNPDWFWSLLNQNDQYKRMYDFSTAHLPINDGLEPTFDADLSGNDLENRLISSVHFLGLGWILVVVGAVILIATGRRYRLANGVVAGIFLLLLVPPWAANYYRDKGDKLLGQNLAGRALEYYGLARRFDSYMVYNPEFVIHLGEADYRLGRQNTAEAHFYRGDQLSQSGKPQEAAFEIQKGMEAGLSEQSRRMAGEYLTGLYIVTGLGFFDGGEKQKSIFFFQKALDVHPVQIEAAYYIAKAQYDLGYYSDAVEANFKVLRWAKNPIILANANANLGDCYYKQGNILLARQYYGNSMKLDTFNNLRALKSLVGP